MESKDFIEVESKWDILKKIVIERLRATFQKCPHCFFSEHDIHSVLYSLAREELKQLGVDSQVTRDGYVTSLVHHEYPTPFRCDMHGYGFRIASDREKTSKGGLYKRGHYDLVILNPVFIKDNLMDAVCGKDYHIFRLQMCKIKVEPLIWACEILYFPRIKKLPQKAIRIIQQDVLKIKETLRYKVNHHKFCRIGSVHVFTNHLYNEAAGLEQETAKLAKNHEIEITFTTA